MNEEGKGRQEECARGNRFARLEHVPHRGEKASDKAGERRRKRRGMRRLLPLLGLFALRCTAQFDQQSNLDMRQDSFYHVGCPSEWQWQCKDGECIAQYDVCDGITQCRDGSDEQACDDVAKKKNQNQNRRKTTVPPPTTTTTAPAYFSMTRREFFFMSALLLVVLTSVICFFRRRAKARALNRNRRGNISQSMFSNESDEDDILISSMYS